MESPTNTRLSVKVISPDVKLILGGKELIKERAIEIAFPNSPSIEGFGFKIQGNNLQIRKYNFNEF